MIIGMRRFRLRYLSRWLCSAILLGSLSVVHARPQLSSEDMTRLDKTEVVGFSKRVSGTGVMSGKAIGIVYDRPEAVLKVILDIANYKAFLPKIKESRLIKVRGDHFFAVLESDLPWPVEDAWVYAKFVKATKANHTYELRWNMINGTMKHASGFILIEPWNEDATQTALTNEIHIEPDTMAPDATLSKGTKSIAVNMVHHFRLRTQKTSSSTATLSSPQRAALTKGSSVSNP